MDSALTMAPDRTETLTREELYLFDAMGFVRLPGFLSAAAVQACRDEVRRLPSRRMGVKQDKERFDDLFARSPLFHDLAESEAARRCVEPVVNQPYRLIESYALRRGRDSSFSLHNGFSEIVGYGDGRRVGRNMTFMHTFHDGKLFCMFVKLLIYLTDVRAPDDGPFCYLQGSHKANWPWFPSLEGHGDVPIDTAHFPSLAHALVETGDAILLNEALLHGTLHKTSEGERLVLAFSYAPAFVTDWREIDRHSSTLRQLGHY